jgi:hypothetical protein
MDCSGKDGAIQNVLTGLNPTGFDVNAIKNPTPADLGHGYLWRVQQKTPQRGNIVVSTVSYYEDVLVTRVHEEISDETARRRFVEIRNFEEYLTGNHTVLLKFFLHISKDFQKEKLKERLKNPRSTGSSPKTIWRSANTGTTTSVAIRTSFPTAVQSARPGMWFHPTIGGSGTTSFSIPSSMRSRNSSSNTRSFGATCGR